MNSHLFSLPIQSNVSINKHTTLPYIIFKNTLKLHYVSQVKAKPNTFLQGKALLKFLFLVLLRFPIRIQLCQYKNQQRDKETLYLNQHTIRRELKTLLISECANGRLCFVSLGLPLQYIIQTIQIIINLWPFFVLWQSVAVQAARKFYIVFTCSPENFHEIKF